MNIWIQRQPTKWSCLSTSFAILLGVPVAELHEMLGHDGSEIYYPGEQEPKCRRGFHPQEFISLLMDMGIAVVTFEALPVSTVRGTTFTHYPYEVQRAQERFDRILSKYVGVICGKSEKGNLHAVAWDGFGAICPTQGRRIDLSGFEVECFFAVIDLRSS